MTANNELYKPGPKSFPKMSFGKNGIDVVTINCGIKVIIPGNIMEISITLYKIPLP